MNRLEIIGFIGQDAVVKDLGSNQVINFSVAVSESYVNKTTNEKVTNTTWFDCAKWGNNTVIAQYLKKGTQLYISGKPNNRGWLNENGEVKIANGITVNEITLLAGAKVNSETPTPSEPLKQSTSPTDVEIPSTSEENDDLPFN